MHAGIVCVFVGLGAGLAVGAVTEAAKRGLGLANISDSSRSLLFAKSGFTSTEKRQKYM